MLFKQKAKKRRVPKKRTVDPQTYYAKTPQRQSKPEYGGKEAVR
jgi:hypothetical protein